MTTQSWNTRARHDSDAMFREWGLELNTKVLAAGLVQTGDTGQANWATATRAGTNADAVYEIYRMNDSMQGTAPVFFKFIYGTGGNASAARLKIQVGTATNGAGTLSGTCLSTERNVILGNSVMNTDTLFNSYCCVVDGCFWFAWKVNASINAVGLFFFCRTCDSTGAATALGSINAWTYNHGSSFETQAMRFSATAAAYAAVSGYNIAGLCANWQGFTSTLTGGDTQPERCWTRTPATAPIFGICGVLSAEITSGNTLLTTLVGSTPRTYIAVYANVIAIGHGTPAPRPAMIWE